ncbi:LPS export ABC transporter protein LptC [Geothermobacter ehrlichii]|uniref:LPS export ABC transporter protein LptC n=1 Tax=Geothermobacter ehrlichii TaxID=213224 RepID=A0A5D3WMD3_9BACT|nr:LPS export ABC transporter periplasmic protein LptC [Geothermobacter ehrlichii]TYO99506.1 LPS export ABC transporter protein LptC [Geothermobacter ehrlichii]
MLLVAFVVLAVLLAFVVGRRYQPVEEAITTAQPAGDADLSLDNIDYTETRNGRAVWRLRAVGGSHDLQAGVTRLRQVDLVFYGREGRGDLRLTADRGVWDSRSGRLEAFGHVRASDDRGYVLTSERMFYDQNRRLVWTDGPVRLTSTAMEVRGRGLRLFVDQRRLRLLSDVWSRWQLGPLAEERG